MKYTIKNDSKIISMPLHFEKGNFEKLINFNIFTSLDSEIYDMTWVSPLKLLLVYCYSTSTDKKSKIISFNFNKTNPSPAVYISDFQAPRNLGKVMRLNKAQNCLYLAEKSQSGFCNLRVLSELTHNQPKYDYTVKIDGGLKEFDVIDSNKVAVLTKNHKLKIFKLGRTSLKDQIADVGSILPTNSSSKLCNLHVGPKSKLLGVCVYGKVGSERVFEKIMLFCINKNHTKSGKSRIELKKLHHMEVKLFAKPSIVKYCIPFYRGNTAVLLLAEQSTQSSTKFSLYGFDMKQRVRLGEEVHINQRGLQCLMMAKTDNGEYLRNKGHAFGLAKNGNLYCLNIGF